MKEITFFQLTIILMLTNFLLSSIKSFKPLRFKFLNLLGFIFSIAINNLYYVSKYHKKSYLHLFLSIFLGPFYTLYILLQ
jgi:ABC-type iron transport system FetAB permease component